MTLWVWFTERWSLFRFTQKWDDDLFYYFIWLTQQSITYSPTHNLVKQKDDQVRWANSARIKTGFKFVVWIKQVFLLIILPRTAAAEKAPDYVSELEKSFSHALWAASIHHLCSVCRVKSASRPFCQGMASQYHLVKNKTTENKNFCIYR